MIQSKPTTFQALLPLIVLVGLLSFNVLGVYGNAALEGSNQIILLVSGFVALTVARYNKHSWDSLFDHVAQSIQSSASAIIILLLIGALASSWLIGGVVPAMVFYGLELLHPRFFLPASIVISAIVSIVTGSSWSTSATVGIALMGIGNAMGISSAMTAGAVISGAYFGDKMSPLSDTTNLAAAMAGAPLIAHIRYMAYTTVPTLLVTILVFLIIGFKNSSDFQMSEVVSIQLQLKQYFYISPLLFLPPLGVIVLIYKRIPAIPAVFLGTVFGILCALIFQIDLIERLKNANMAFPTYRLIMDCLGTGVQINTQNELLNDLLKSRGMSGMLGTIWLILCAMVFGGAMEGAGLLQLLSLKLMRLAKSNFGLFSTTTLTCTGLNLTASDQYLAIVVPGRMYADAFKKRGLAPENLSRTLEDCGTVTSALVPWNTCGAYQSSVLQVSTGAYLPFAIFNWLSPLMTLFFAYFNIKIRKRIKV